MECCTGNKTGPEDEEEDLDGPMEDRSCTDIIFLVLFAAFLVGMFILFGIGVNKGDPYRILAGTDVAGNICGRSNDVISGVSGSGADLQSNHYLYYDWIRTAKILGEAALTKSIDGLNLLGDNTSVDAALSGVNFQPGTTIPRDFCLDGVYSTSPSRLLKPRGGVYSLEQKQFQYYRDTAPSSQSVKGIVISRKLMKNQTEMVVLLQKDGAFKVWKTSKASSSDQAAELVSEDPISSAVSGGRVCRYCLEKCPDGFESLLNRCVPSKLGEGAGSVLSGSGIQELGQELVQDFQVSQREMAYMGVIALGLSILMTVAFRFLAGIIVYVIIALVVVICVVGTIALWVVWYLKKTALAEEENVLNSASDAANGTAAGDIIKNSLNGLSTAEHQSEVHYWLAGAIGASILTVVVLLVLLILRKRIALVVSLFHEAGKAVHSMPYLVFMPLLTFLALSVTTVLWLYGTLWILSAGHPETDPVTTYVKYKPDTFMTWMRWYHVFGGLWISQFCIACQHLVIAGSVAGWYFAKDKSSVGLHTVVAAGWRLLRYHLGTAAFGSFIIALIQLVRIILMYIEHIVKKYEKKGCGAGGKIVVVILKIILKCLQCCVACFERFMKFININAYIETAIYGYNFCRAAMKAFQLLASNALRVAAINSIGSFVLFLGKIVVVIATGVISYYILKDNKEVQYLWPQIVVSVLFAYLIAHTFIGVYSMAIDTIFLCFCEDCSRNDGINKPYYMSRELMQFVENSKKALEALERKNMKQTESKQFLVQERKDSITMVDIDD